MMSYFCVVADDQIRYPIEPVSASAAGRDQGRSMVGRQGPGRKVLVSYFFPQTFISLNNFDCWRVVFRVPGERKE